MLNGPIPSEVGLLSQLQVFALSNNNLTSTIPGDLLALPRLQYISLSNNCFSGSLPSCSDYKYGSSLKVIDMNALSSGRCCQNPVYFFQKLGFKGSVGFYPNNFMSGGVPPCLWKLPNLTTMYLAGNG